MSDCKEPLPSGGAAKPAQKQPKLYEIGPRDRLALGLALLLCLLLADGVLWYGPGAGVTAAVFVFYGAVMALLGAAPLRRRENRVLLGANLLLALTFVLGSNWAFRLWNFLALLALVPIHAFSLSGAATLPWWRPAMLWERLRLLCGGLFGSLGATAAVLTPTGSRAGKRLPAILGGVGAALALVALLLPVLSSADALFAAATFSLREFIRLHFSQAVWKLVIALCMTPFFFGLLYRLRRPAAVQTAVPLSPRVDALVFLLVLLALDGLYLLFLAVQSAGLLGGEAYLAARGIRYADWARSGFFQMVGVTIVNLTALLTAVALSRRDGRLWQALRLAAALLLAESFALLVSAALRMTLYVSVYGLSFKRVMTYWGMGMMALFFLLAAWKLLRPDTSFCRMAFPVALAGWLVINCVPIDYLAAKDNVDRYLDGRSDQVSVHYLLYDLSFDALSQLERLDGKRLAAKYGGWWGENLTLNALIKQRQASAAEQCAHWQTWSLSAYLASR